MNELLRCMLRYYGVGEVMMLAGYVEENDLRYRWIRRAAVRAEMSCEAQIKRAKSDVRA